MEFATGHLPRLLLFSLKKKDSQNSKPFIISKRHGFDENWSVQPVINPTSKQRPKRNNTERTATLGHTILTKHGDEDARIYAENTKKNCSLEARFSTCFMWISWASKIHLKKQFVHNAAVREETQLICNSLEFQLMYSKVLARLRSSTADAFWHHKDSNRFKQLFYFWHAAHPPSKLSLSEMDMGLLPTS